jgi:hypothetical protein
MAFREKSAWINLFVTLAIWGLYFAKLLPGLGLERVDVGAALGNFLSSVTLAVVLQVVLVVVLALLSPRDANAPADERERLIALRSTSLAYHVMSATLVMAVIGVPVLLVYQAQRYGGVPGLASALVPMANGVLLAMVLGELVRSLAQVLQFRRDALA